MLAERVVGQRAVHEVHGGIVPRLAAAAHARALPELVRAYVRTPRPARVRRAAPDRPRAAASTNRTLDDCRLEMSDIDAVAVTRGPGLGPCLSVGLNGAKTLAAVSRVPLLGVHHMVRCRPPPHRPVSIARLMDACGGCFGGRRQHMR